MRLHAISAVIATGSALSLVSWLVPDARLSAQITGQTPVEILEYSCEENNRSLWEGRLKLWLPPWAKKK